MRGGSCLAQLFAPRRNPQWVWRRLLELWFINITPATKQYHSPTPIATCILAVGFNFDAGLGLALGVERNLEQKLTGSLKMLFYSIYISFTVFLFSLSFAPSSFLLLFFFLFLYTGSFSSWREFGFLVRG
jgi:hypothetical protein